MELYPAIDLLDGQCVRLTRGDFKRVTVYSDDPVRVAEKFAQAGARWVHVVDLNGARTGVPANLPLVRQIASVAGLRVQMGGGVRDADAAERMLANGISRCVIGTAALNSALLQELGRRFGDHVAVGMDVDAGTVRVEGWTEDSGVEIDAFLGRLREAKVVHLVVTDISRDGMLSGPNATLLRRVIGPDFRVVASGGISSLEDLRRLAIEAPELEGVIAGKAIYEKRLAVADAVALLQGQPGSRSS